MDVTLLLDEIHRTITAIPSDSDRWAAVETIIRAAAASAGSAPVGPSFFEALMDATLDNDEAMDRLLSAVFEDHPMPGDRPHLTAVPSDEPSSFTRRRRPRASDRAARSGCHLALVAPVAEITALRSVPVGAGAGPDDAA
jgi:hypothetical protein